MLAVAKLIKRVVVDELLEDELSVVPEAAPDTTLPPRLKFIELLVLFVC